MIEPGTVQCLTINFFRTTSGGRVLYLLDDKDNWMIKSDKSSSLPVGNHPCFVVCKQKHASRVLVIMPDRIVFTYSFFGKGDQ